MIARLIILLVLLASTVNAQEKITILENEKLYNGNNGLVLKKISLPKIVGDPFIFITAKIKSIGDPYDRTGSIFMVSDTTDIDNKIGKCPIELMRFFTPFGVGKYNEKFKVPGINFKKEAFYKNEISHLLPKLKGDVWIGTYVNNFHKKGFVASVYMEIYPKNKKPVLKATKKYVQPLFYSIIHNHDFFNSDIHAEFVVPEKVNNLKLLFTTTGHGGWATGDEFVQRVNTISIDGTKVFSIIPWRMDSATYRDLNPASGDFWNGMSSYHLSRSNWSPGTITNPMIIPLNNLKSGKHRISLSIPQGSKECSWNVAALLVGICN